MMVSGRGIVAAACVAAACVATGCGDGGDDDGTGADAPLAVDNDEPTRVRVLDGLVRGEVDRGSVRFLKIPFAEPPVGELRWKAPQAPEPWEGERFETDFSEPCAQASSQQGPASENEDCLYLNVWRPEAATEGAPVMVWIHGGGNTTGSTRDIVPLSPGTLWYDGRVFAERHGIVVVTTNYRLGALGFMAHPALADEDSPVGNQGLQDQQQALRWVRDNIVAFGGDPENVTIFGESAGSADVCLHVVSPGSRGLFHRAVSQSGGCTTRGIDSDATAEALSQWAAELGCDDADQVLACLRDRPVTELVDYTPSNRSAGDTPSIDYFGVSIDGTFLPESPAALFEKGEVADVPYILGSNTEEGHLYTVTVELPEDDDAFLEMLRPTYGSFAERVLETYSVDRFDGDYRHALSRIRGDQGLVCGTDATARAAHAAGMKVFMYNFNIPWSIQPTLFGPTHASEISHVFGLPYMDTPEHEAVAVEMNAFWARFAATGDPNGEDAVVSWPAFEPSGAGDGERLQLDPDFDVLGGHRAEECAMWREYRETCADGC